MYYRHQSHWRSFKVETWIPRIVLPDKIAGNNSKIKRFHIGEKRSSCSIIHDKRSHILHTPLQAVPVEIITCVTVDDAYLCGASGTHTVIGITIQSGSQNHILDMHPTLNNSIGIGHINKGPSIARCIIKGYITY